MSAAITPTAETVWDLPPLILHPFSERIPPAVLIENSKAVLIAAGVLPPDGRDREEWKRRLLAGRHTEVRMLYFLGKDVFRWIGQCLEIALRSPGLEADSITRQSFAGLLTAGPPAQVREKLIAWGVMDHGPIFRRAIGIHWLFAEPPTLTTISEDFLQNYHRTADLLFQGFMESEPHRLLAAQHFRFQLYASGEYTKMLESEWTK